ncbi:multiple epidermal growth factor-like domains protein 10 isoform X2 [Liolophura sinensis]|uniref:multiple epidermal growth factor-like domains protein 10 isoform X2 n=1 Tax=Liolophura sinensis TaxID=3198878 RepID=UPI00315879F6
MASEDNTGCITAAYHGDVCVSRCAGLNMTCDTNTTRCVCNPGCHLAADGRNCVLNGFSLLDGGCNVTEDCLHPREKECVNGTCVCQDGLRSSTEFEIRAFNSELPQCRNYSSARLGLFNSCTFNWDCPSNALCKERNPNGTICYCNAGFVSSLDRTACEAAAYYNDSCVTRCAGMFTTCDAVTKRCVCNPGYYRGNDGLNCVLPGYDLLGQACSRRCQLSNEQSCVNNVCFCNAGLRPMTGEELMAFDYRGQCIDETYFLTHSIVFGVCFNDAQCPQNARCRLRGCDGYLCTCSAGYTPSIDYRTCEKDAFYDEPCITRCAGVNMICHDLTKTCRCQSGMIPNSNGKHCTPENRPLLGEICDMSRDDCYLDEEQTCVNGRCACRNGTRRATCDEILAFNDTLSQCRPEEYSLDFCLNLTTTTTTLYTWPSVWTSGSVSLYGVCLWDYQCTSYAACKPRDCTGNVCYCNVGYVASLDLKTCEKAAYYNETCVTRCAGLFMKCNQEKKTCECEKGYIPGCDGTFCERPGRPLLGERCLDTCFLSREQECINGRCACREDLRRATDEEIRAFNNETLQCVFSNFTLGSCNPRSPENTSPGNMSPGLSFIPHEILWPSVAGFLCLCVLVFVVGVLCRKVCTSGKKAPPSSSKEESSIEDEDRPFSLPRPDIWHQGFYRGDRSWASVPEDRFGNSAFPFGTGHFSTGSTDSTDDA